MGIKGWKYYNHAAIPDCAPDEQPDLSPVENNLIFKSGIHNGKTALLARWVTDWDCSEETNWWYVIKDDAYDIAKLKAKRRYEINKARKNFTVEKIEGKDYKEQIFEIAVKAFSVYPEKYRPTLEKESFLKDIEAHWDRYTVFLAFDTQGQACGYAYLIEKDHWIDFRVLKADPEQERNGINAALVDAVCSYYHDVLESGTAYISDGSRSVLHETKFQDYLIKYFGFRKVYCKLHLKYKPGIKAIINILSLFKKKILKSDHKLWSKVAAIMIMDEYTK